MTSPFEVAARRVAGGEDHRKVAADLVAQLTLDELLGCLDGDTELWPGLADIASGGYHAHPWPAAVLERLGIPGLQFSDGPRGVVIGASTCFPVSMARGATFDPDLEERVGDAIGLELRAAGATFYGGVCVNLLRHPAWGRAQETYGEDPFLVGEMGAALTRGVQRHAMACVKHFALNSMENSRFTVDVSADERTLHEVYLPHFRRVVEEGVASVMTAYNSVNGSWCGENDHLVTTVLRDEWDFDGFVITDFVFGLRDPVRSVLAGVDVEMPFRQQRARALPGAVEDGSLPLAAAESAATRTIATLLRFADRIAAPRPGPDVTASPAHRALAREVAQRSIVLLRNQPVSGGAVLPLDPSGLRRVAVVGRLAAEANLGDHGSSQVVPPDAVTPLDGLRAALPDTGIVSVGDDVAAAAAAATSADVAIVVVGLNHVDEGEFLDAGTTEALSALLPPPAGQADGLDMAALMTDAPAAAPSPAAPEGFAVGGDRRSLDLHPEDVTLLSAVAAANPRTVVVLVGGSAILVDPWYEQVPAILHAFYPGMEGGHALADVLLGHVEPSGRLPFAVPTDAAHLPRFDLKATSAVYDLWHGQWKLHRDGHRARFPFGFGLTYAAAAVSAAEVRLRGDHVHVAVTVANSGAHPSPEVVQVYAGGPEGGVERPERRLVGFTRVVVPPEGSATCELMIPLERLAVRLAGAWALEPGEHRVSVALHADDAGVSSSVDLAGGRLPMP